jgi:hypothetical protein
LILMARGRYEKAKRGDLAPNEMVRIGVPAEERRKVWLRFSGAQKRMDMYTTLYDDLLKLALGAEGSPENAAARRQIDLDLPRTFPLHQELSTPEGTTALRNVLLAYSVRNSAVGYCQSMNFIAALFLLHVPEKPAFWLLTTLIEEILPPKYFDEGKVSCSPSQATHIPLPCPSPCPALPADRSACLPLTSLCVCARARARACVSLKVAGEGSMSGVLVDLRVCEELLATLVPAAAAHLGELDAWTYGLRGMLTQWFMMLFVTALPLETTCRACDDSIVG